MKITLTTDHPCICGCGETVPAKSMYRPGHDSRHVSRVGHDVAEAVLNEKNATRRDRKVRVLLDELPTDPLVDRANSIAETAIKRYSHVRAS